MKAVLALCLVAVACCQAQRKFPNDFLFGTATASYQIEGAWNEDGKGENIWDFMTHTNPTVIKDVSNGDIAGDSYHNYKRDVEMMRELGIDAYRFSLSWARILPNGMSNKVNQAGIDFYNNYINEMLKYNIQPMVTLYHWDLPQKLQELGGFQNPLIADWFEDYARVVYESFGDRVKLWITFNEPREICYEGYGALTKAPRLNATAVGTYICAKNLVIAHAKAYHLYNNELKAKQGGQCGITISCNWITERTDSEQDKAAAELRRQAEWGLYAEPIFSEQGGFPKELSALVAKKSAKQGYPRSRLPTFTEEERIYVRGYGALTKAPRLNATAVGTYICAKNLVIAHAKAYHLYNNEFKAKQGGQCGITISCNWITERTDSEQDKAAAELRRQAEWGLYAEPIFSEQGGFPKELSALVAEKSAKQGYPRSRLPTFTEEERIYVRGAADFFGLNHYSGSLVHAHEYGDVEPTLITDSGTMTSIPDDWMTSASSWLFLAPNSILNSLNHLHNRYNHPTFYITENGWSTPPGHGLIDTDRITYYRAALENVLDALDAGIDLRGYMAWSLMDNFEWMQGYAERFGLYEIDFEDPARPRTARKSALVYKHIVKHRYIDSTYDPEDLTMTIDEGH